MLMRVDTEPKFTDVFLGLLYICIPDVIQFFNRLFVSKQKQKKAKNKTEQKN